MVGSIFDTIGEVLTEYVSVISGMFESLVKIFYNSETNTLTLFGTLFLIAVGIGIVAWGFNLVRNLINL